MPLVRLLGFLVLSGLITYVVELYSFTLAHSAAGILAVLVCPGILVVVANLLSGPLSWAVVVAINVLYYELVWRLIRRGRKQAA
jgi:hypothetical protein